MMTGTVLITGASGGIGRATALLFGQKGWNVAVGYNTNAAGAAEVAEQINSRWTHAAAFYGDVSSYVNVQTMVSDVLERFGQIDVLVNNAGIASYGLFQDMTPADMQRVVDVNVLGTAYCTQAVLPGMLSRRSGAIVNVSSVWGVHGGSCEVIYSASKAAVIGFTKALAKEVGPSGIRVNCIAPGPVNTRMMDAFTQKEKDDICADTALGFIGEPHDAAEAVWFLAAAPSRYITGEVLNLNGGMYT